MRWVRRGGLVAGTLAAAALVGCGHGQAEQASTAEYEQPYQQTAENQQYQQQQYQQQATKTQQPSVSVSSERKPVAGHEDVKLQPKGKYSVPAGSYRVPEGEYLAPKGIYGERGQIFSQGKLMSQGEYGTYTKPEGTVRQPEGVTTTREGTFYKQFGSSEISNQRQPVAGHDAQASTFFIRDEQGRTWSISNPTLIKRVEQKLSEQGCDPGRTDGVADQQFGKAVMQCQDKLGVQQTGVIDAATARALGLDWSQLRMRYEHRKDLQQQQP